ncbi:hypothetical protein L0U85_12735 [Glycomyces sp. L485]|uniref:hypothetical protein n=1 Tax=Glycomyces sp. L485 TaxID=2909235 RepID=UPI001F4A9302|nr:hypothetical protein [Glycomyces sp. L485]MCH7231710.1 hypothetical protein [Glycomyces sp. L485]
MSVVERLKGGMKSGAGSVWAVTKKAVLKLAIAAAIVVVVATLIERGEGSAADTGGTGSVPAEGRAVAAQATVLSEENAGEQLMLCRYEVHATFGVSIFTDSKMSSKRLVRIWSGDEINGSCEPREGERTLGCAGLSWDTEWIRVHSGTTVGWSPASCLERVGFF